MTNSPPLLHISFLPLSPFPWGPGYNPGTNFANFEILDAEF